MGGRSSRLDNSSTSHQPLEVTLEEEKEEDISQDVQVERPQDVQVILNNTVDGTINQEETSPSKEITVHQDNEQHCSDVEPTSMISSIISDTMNEEEDSSSSSDNEQMSCQFHVILKSQKNGEKRNKLITLSRYPKTGIELMKQLEVQFHVPVCVQDLYFYTTQIHTETKLKKLRVQHGDTLHLEYPSEADIDYFSSLIGTLARIMCVLHDVVDKISHGLPITQEMHQLLQLDCISFTGDCIPLRYFSVYPTGTPNSNQLYFINSSGLSALLVVYELIHQLPWHKLPWELQELEFSCLQIIWNFSATLGVRQLILKNGVMDEVFKSLMRTKVIPYQPVFFVEPLEDPFASHDRSTYVLAETIYASIVVIGNFAEVPQCRVPIASTPNVIDTMIAAMLSMTYTYTCARSGMCAILCLSFSPETHGYFYDEVFLNRILEICDRTHHVNDGTAITERTVNQTLVEFYALIFFANLIHHWKKHTPLPDIFISSVKSFMEEYITNITYIIIHQRMQEKRYYWSTFIPFLSLCYSPKAHDTSVDATIPLDLRLLCIKAGLLSMKCMCIAENAEDVIRHEGLMDYIVCSSWFMPDEETTLSAKDLVYIAQQNLHLKPPSLTNIIRAQLASYDCGLDTALHYDVHSVIMESAAMLQ